MLQKIWDDGCKPQDDRHPAEWMQDNIKRISYSPIPGPFRYTNSMHVLEPLAAMSDVTIPLIFIRASIQASKSLMLEMFTMWVISQSPGPMLWLNESDAAAKDQSTTRLEPLIEDCNPVKKLKSDNRHDTTKARKIFKNGMTLWNLGAENKKNLQRRSIRYLIGDETWEWPAGHMAEAEARCLAFGWLAKIIFASQGGIAGDDSDKKFLETDQRELTFRCPECDRQQFYKWSQVDWPKDNKDENEEYDFAFINKNTVYICDNIECNARLADTFAMRKEMNRGVYVATNPKADKGKVGFTYNSIATMSWGKLAELYLRAKECARRGDIEPMKQFYQKRLAKSWDEQFEETDFKISVSKNYKFGDTYEQEGGITSHGKFISPPFPEGIKIMHPLRFLTVDCQIDHLFTVVRGWSKDGSSRLLHYEKVLSYDDIILLQRKFNIHKSLVFIDAGYNTYDVYRQCAKEGWTALMGDKRKTFPHIIKLDGGKTKTVQKFYSQKRKISIGRGSSCSMFYWSNLNIKDMLARLKRNQDPSKGVTWEIPEDASEEYLHGIDSERRNKLVNGSYEWQQIGKRPNHPWDCECMSVCAALMNKIIGKEAVEKDEKENIKEDVEEIDTETENVDHN